MQSGLVGELAEKQVRQTFGFASIAFTQLPNTLTREGTRIASWMSLRRRTDMMRAHVSQKQLGVS